MSQSLPQTQSLILPDFCLIMMMGISGSGKSHFAHHHFKATEIISSDACRAMICDDPANQDVTEDAFELVHLIAEKRLKQGHLTVIDATHLQSFARQQIVKLAKKYHAPVIALVLDRPLDLCIEQNQQRCRHVPATVIHQQYQQLQDFIHQHQKNKSGRFQGISEFHYIRTDPTDTNLEITRKNLPMMQSGRKGPFDIIGDIHGCADELWQLLLKMGYQLAGDVAQLKISHPEGRQLIFVGDLVDRGPKTDNVLQIVMAAWQQGVCLGVMGNHDDKLLRYLRGGKVQIAHGLQESLTQIENFSAAEKQKICDFLTDLPAYLYLDEGRLAVVHAGIKPRYLGRYSPRIRAYCLVGPVTGQKDEAGYPIREDWAKDYHGDTLIVYGHTPVQTARWAGNSVNLDTGCVYGGALTALRYPEQEIISVPAQKTYYPRNRPFFVPSD